jgi:hypothetical protein
MLASMIIYGHRCIYDTWYLVPCHELSLHLTAHHRACLCLWRTPSPSLHSPAKPQQHCAQHDEHGTVARHVHRLAVGIKTAEARTHQPCTHQAHETAAHVHHTWGTTGRERLGCGRPKQMGILWSGMVEKALAKVVNSPVKSYLCKLSTSQMPMW